MTPESWVALVKWIKPVERIRKALFRRKLRKASERGLPIDIGVLKQEADVNTEQVFAIVRHALTAAGSSLVANGLLSESDLNAVVGGLVVVGTVLWAYFNKKKPE